MSEANDPKETESVTSVRVEGDVRGAGSRYLRSGHEWDDYGCCKLCGFDATEFWLWRRHTYEGQASGKEMPKCGAMRLAHNRY